MADIADMLGMSHGTGSRFTGPSMSMGEEAMKIMHASQTGSANDFKRKKKPKGRVGTHVGCDDTACNNRSSVFYLYTHHIITVLSRHEKRGV